MRRQRIRQASQHLYKQREGSKVSGFNFGKDVKQGPEGHMVVSTQCWSALKASSLSHSCSCAHTHTHTSQLLDVQRCSLPPLPRPTSSGVSRSTSQV